MTEATLGSGPTIDGGHNRQVLVDISESFRASQAAPEEAPEEDEEEEEA